ncbi:MAG: DUF1800 domain-containing protein [Candidatus Binatia bacterium]
MLRTAAWFVGGLALSLLHSGAVATAAETGVTGKKLLLKSPSRIILWSKDLAITTTGSDPMSGANSWVSFDDGRGPVTFNLPATLWRSNRSSTLFKYNNPSAPSGPSPVKIAKVRAGQLQIVAKGLPFPVPNGPASIAVVLSLDGGSNTYCMNFTGTGDGGRFLAKNSQAGSCPPASISKPQAFRFLNQATFGATDAEAERLIGLGTSATAYSRWIDEQLALPPSTQLAFVQAARPIPTPPGFDYSRLHFDRRDIWFQNSVGGSDQLRQRVAWALSQILVTSQVSLANRYPFGLADYHDLLVRYAFGDFRQLIEKVTLHPMMGIYLSMLGNRKPNAALNIRPDENYARELMQLFTIGLVALDADGTPRTDANDQPIPTYDQAVVEGFAHVFTGWHWACTFGSPANCGFSNTQGTVPNQILPMQLFPDEHDIGEKQLLSYPNAVSSVLPAGQSAQQDLAAALDNIFHHPNVGPFISRQLIQRLVTSNPSPAYIARVSAAFDDDGSGQRGNLGAVVRAILLDTEARAPASTANPDASKLKEPVLRLTQLWRAYDGRAANGRYFNIDPAVDFGQGPLQAPSVFNFYSPFYAPPGEISDLGLVAPEMQIATEYQNTRVTNYFYTQIFLRNSTRTVTNENVVVIDIDEEVALAADPAALVEKIAEKLLGGQISDPLRAEVEQKVAQVPSVDAPQRVAEALWLVSTSPEFAILR